MRFLLWLIGNIVSFILTCPYIFVTLWMIVYATYKKWTLRDHPCWMMPYYPIQYFNETFDKLWPMKETK